MACGDRFKSQHQLFIECRSYEELLAGRLDQKPNEYAMVVIDEAHVFRNPDTKGCRRRCVGY